jgi:RNA recognition motif-containing protein
MASKTLYIGNIPYSSSEQDLFDHFSAYNPTQARIVEGRGFAFLDIDGDKLQDAIDSMHQSDMGGRRITVNEAKPKGAGGGGFDRDNRRY